MTGQRLPTRTLTYWRIRLLLFCIAPAVFGRFFLLYSGKAVYYLDLCVDVVIFAAVFCLLSNVLSFLPIFSQWDAGAGQPRRYL